MIPSSMSTWSGSSSSGRSSGHMQRVWTGCQLSAAEVEAGCIIYGCLNAFLLTIAPAIEPSLSGRAAAVAVACPLLNAFFRDPAPCQQAFNKVPEREARESKYHAATVVATMSKTRSATKTASMTGVQVLPIGKVFNKIRNKSHGTTRDASCQGLSHPQSSCLQQRATDLHTNPCSNRVGLDRSNHHLRQGRCPNR